MWVLWGLRRRCLVVERKWRSAKDIGVSCIEVICLFFNRKSISVCTLFDINSGTSSVTAAMTGGNHSLHSRPHNLILLNE